MGTARHDITIPPGLAWRWRVEMHDANGPILTPGWSGEFKVLDRAGSELLKSTVSPVEGVFELSVAASASAGWTGGGTYHLHALPPQSDPVGVVCGSVSFSEFSRQSNDGATIIVERETVRIVAGGVQGQPGPAGGGNIDGGTFN